MLKQGERAPDLVLRDGTGANVALSDLWRNGPLVLVFLRHFG
jgi:peroxiredoxin